MVSEGTATLERAPQPAATDPRARLLDGLPVREERMKLAGIDTAVLVGGEGPPVVLLHGPGEFGAKWVRVLPQLAERHRVIAPDLPGHGSSAAGEAALDVDVALRWLDELIERTCAAPPAVVGHVLGGAMAARYAARPGARVGRLVLVDSLGLGRFRPVAGFGLALLRFSIRPSERNHERLWRRCSYDLDALRAGMGEQWASFEDYNLAGARSKTQQKALRALMSRVGVPPIPAEELARIEAPTALIWGRHDQANRLAVAEAASERHGWPLAVIEDAADDPVLDQPAAFLRALARALGAG